MRLHARQGASATRPPIIVREGKATYKSCGQSNSKNGGSDARHFEVRRDRARCHPGALAVERPGGRADQDRLQHGPDRRARAQRQVGAAGDAGLGEGRERQGRAPRSPGAARLLRRPEPAFDRTGDLYEAPRHRQGRSRRRALCDGADRAGHADRDAAQPRLHHALGPFGQRRVPLSALFPDRAQRLRHQGLHQGLLRSRRGADAEAADDRDRVRRPAICACQCRRRARHRQGSRPQGHLRQELSADDGRLLADRARGAGDQSRHFRDRVLPARFGRHGARHPRGELHAQDGRRPAWSACRRRPSRRNSARC